MEQLAQCVCARTHRSPVSTFNEIFRIYVIAGDYMCVVDQRCSVCSGVTKECNQTWLRLLKSYRKYRKKATDRVVERVLDFVVKHLDHIIETILKVSVFVLANLYGWSIFKQVSRVLYGCPKPREPSRERLLCNCACCGRSTSTPSFDVEEQREK